MSRSVRRVLIATLMAMPIVGAGQTASAAPVDLVCPFAANFDITPGITLTQKPVQITGSIALGTSLLAATPCSSVLTGVPYTGGTATVSGAGTLACVTIGNGLTGSVTATINVTWNNGDTSTVTTNVIFVGFVPVTLASVTAGAMQGSPVLVAAVPVGLSGSCFLSPTTSFSFVGVATVTNLS